MKRLTVTGIYNYTLQSMFNKYIEEMDITGLLLQQKDEVGSETPQGRSAKMSREIFYSYKKCEINFGFTHG